jgi:glyoxylase-like metal-dependent hydrolase (beta-lactamase superfamily II)
MAVPPYTRGLHALGDRTWVWLQPDGGWGWSNAGLVAGAARSLLVDTLFDLRLTREMLDAMHPFTSARPIRTLVNTHANGDHCWGNQLLDGAEIVASAACAEEMTELDPALLAGLVRAEGLGPLGDYLRRIFGAFEFAGIRVTPPTCTFVGELALSVDDRELVLIEVGPAHTRGDAIVHLPDDRTVFTGDILFIDGTPVVWAGPIARWIAACDRILALDVETVVPGHGPVTDKAGVRRVREYLAFVDAEAGARYRAGMSAEEAAHDIALGAFTTLRERERIVVNVEAKYREMRGDQTRANVPALFAAMAKFT